MRVKEMSIGNPTTAANSVTNLSCLGTSFIDLRKLELSEIVFTIQKCTSYGPCIIVEGILNINEYKLKLN